MRKQLPYTPPQVIRRKRMTWILIALGVLIVATVAATFLPRTAFVPVALRQPNPPPFLLARNRDNRWQQDLTYLARELPRLHIDAFHTISRADFVAEVDAFESLIPDLTDTEIALWLMALVASIGDGHTSLNFAPFYEGESAWRLFPLSVAWLEDGWYVVGVDGNHRNLLGARLNAIDDTPIDIAFSRIAPLVAADNEVQQRTTGAAMLVTADVLAALEVSDAADQARFAFTLIDGQNVEATLAALAPADVQLQGIQPNPPLPEPPLALRNPERWYWFETLPGTNTLYFQYDRCAEMTDLPFADFTADLFETVARENLTRLVVDLRSNGGGNSSVLRPFLAALAAQPELEVFVLIGRRTFSSALMNAIELDQQANAVLVGEPTGGRPNHFGEVRTLTLPNSQLQVSYSTKFFRMLSEADPPSLIPELAVPVTIDNQLTGYDAALAAALNATLLE